MDEVQMKNYKPQFAQNWTDYMDIPHRHIFYVEFFGSEPFIHYPLDTVIGTPIIDQVRKKEIYLMLHCTGHGPHEIAKEVYRDVIIKYNLPTSHVLLSSESADLNLAVEQFAKHYNLDVIETRFTTEFEGYYADWSKNPNRYEYKFELKNYDKKFLCLNGYYRPHRASLIFLMKSMNLLDKGLISYNIKDGGMNGHDTFFCMQDWFRDNQEALYLIESYKEELLKLDSILLDTQYNPKDNLAVELPQHKELHDNTYFSVITETNFPKWYPEGYVPEIPNDIGRLLSEKIFRTMMYKHPFIVVANPKFLDMLKFLGYKTFEGIIDESYDKEEDGVKRLLMIVKEVKRLSELSQDELKVFLEKAKEICDFNFNVLRSKRNFVYNLPLKV